MTYVFVLLYTADYEGSTVGGVFATSDAAKDSLDPLPKNRKRNWVGTDEQGWHWRAGDEYTTVEIERYEVES